MKSSICTLGYLGQGRLAYVYCGGLSAAACWDIITLLVEADIVKSVNKPKTIVL